MLKHPQTAVQPASGMHPTGRSRWGRGQGAASLQHCPNQNKKNRFCSHDDIKLLHNLLFSWNQVIGWRLVCMYTGIFNT